MTRDPQIKPNICHLYFIEGPPVVVRRYEERIGHIWSHRNGDRAIIITKEGRRFQGCNSASFIIDYNQPEDYEPRKWTAWCNAKHPMPTVHTIEFDAELYRDFRIVIDRESAADAMRRFGRCRIQHTDGFTYTIQPGPKKPLLRAHATKNPIRQTTPPSGHTAIHLRANNRNLGEREGSRGKSIRRGEKTKRT